MFNINKVVMGGIALVLAVLVVITSIFYIKNNSLRADNVELSNKLSHMEKNISLLERENYTLKSLQEAYDLMVVRRDQESKELLSGKESIKTEINNIVKKGNSDVPQKTSINNTVDADITGLLNELCKRVRNGPCPIAK